MVLVLRQPEAQQHLAVALDRLPQQPQEARIKAVAVAAGEVSVGAVAVRES